MSYPPEPWDLRGQLHASTFLVPLADLPLELPPGCRPVRVGERGVVGVAWVVYEPGGVLAYRELMAAVLVRRGARVMPHIVRIWVDSESSRDGGRALWGIPKELARFDVAPDGFGGTSFAAEDERGPIATGLVRPRATLPVAVPTGYRVAQTLHNRTVLSPVRSRARLGVAKAWFTAEPAGPLGFLAGHRPRASVTQHDFRMRFGG